MSCVGLDCSALDPEFKEHAQRGIGRYVRELSRYFDVHNESDPRIGKFDHQELRGGIADRLVDLAPIGRQTLRQQLVYPLRLSSSRLREFDILHFPAHMDAPAWTRKPYVLTVLDLIPLVLSDLYKADRPTWRFRFARWLEIRAITNASLILAISENTARDVSRVLNVPQDRIMVTPLGVDEKFFDAFVPEQQRDATLLSRLGVPEGRQIILYVGGIDQRKNIGFMLDAVADLKTLATERSVAPPVLLMIGKIDQDRQYPALLKKRQQLDLTSDVILGGFVSDSDLLRLYASSDVFFFPSLYEGFGLPVLEAMAAGLPVVSSNASSMPEVVGNCGLVFDPSSISSAVRQLDSMLTTAELRLRMRNEGHRRSMIFSWNRTGSATVDAYRCALRNLNVPVRTDRELSESQRRKQTDLYGSRRDAAA